MWTAWDLPSGAWPSSSAPQERTEPLRFQRTYESPRNAMGWQGRGVWRVGPRFREGGMVLPPPTTLRVVRPHPCLSDEVYVPVRSVSTLCQRLHIQSYLTVCDPMDCSPLGSSVHGISLARILECIAISPSRGSSPPRDPIRNSCIGRRVLY